MPDYFDTLINRAREPGGIRPRVPFLFEPARPGQASITEQPVGPEEGGFAEPEWPATSSEWAPRNAPLDALQHPVDPPAATATPSSPRETERLQARIARLDHQLRELSGRNVPAPSVPSLPTVHRREAAAAREEPPVPSLPQLDDGSRPGDTAPLQPAPGPSPALSAHAPGPASTPSSAAADEPAPRFDSAGRDAMPTVRQPEAPLQLPQSISPVHPLPAPVTPRPLQRDLLPAVSPLPNGPSVAPHALPPVPVPVPHTTIQVHIGRVEVRAAPATSRPQPTRRSVAAPTTLDTYLRSRNGGDQ
jgi:hypothetical protein